MTADSNPPPESTITTATNPVPESEDQNPVKASIEKKGENSYYFAHKKREEDVKNATRIEGEGLADLDGVKKLGEGEVEKIKKIIPLKKFIFEDSEKFAKIHIDFSDIKPTSGPSGAAILSTGKISIHYPILDDFGIDFTTGKKGWQDAMPSGKGIDGGISLGLEVNVTVESSDSKDSSSDSESITYQFLVKDKPLHGPVVPKKSKWRLSSDKTRLVISMAKLNTEDQWYGLFKKEINQWTGWE